MKTEQIDIKKIKLNSKNPRIIKDDKFNKLVKSIQDFPQMLEIRPVVVNDDMVIIGGNMRYRAAIEAGFKKIPVIKAVGLTEAQQDEFIVKDNVGFGEWDFDLLANEFNSELLDDWGVDIPIFKNDEDDIMDKQPDTSISWFINIRCNGEQDAQALYDRLIKEGLDVKIVN